MKIKNLYINKISFCNKNAGFIILLTSIFIFFLFGEIKNISILFYISSIYSYYLFIICYLYIYILLIVIGGQFPQDYFLSHGRILTLYYYFIIICILLSHYLIYDHGNSSPRNGNEEIVTWES